MKSFSDNELIRRSDAGGLEAAFAQLVERYAGLVYSTARRVTNAPDLARDATQIVFIDLLRKLPHVRALLDREASAAASPAVLAGWLHRAARFEALELIRSETRRKAREKSALENQM